MHRYNLNGDQAFDLLRSLANNAMPGSTSEFFGEVIFNELLEEGASIGAGTYMGPFSAIWEFYDLMKKKSFQQFASIVGDVSDEQASMLRSNLVLKPISVEITSGLARVHSVNTHMNNLAGEYETSVSYTEIGKSYIEVSSGTSSKSMWAWGSMVDDFKQVLDALVISYE